ncbi:hypothetical protein NPIL_407491 [Nephila pilipes]|uniref:Secreted protein n=1 Tax=Nephila pilipes TaxID=299642 RepID=A0A8X6PDZ6_NEPPI|nr:hypothetical protein NPIL_407491 [Nephila pilipes]
MRKFLTATLVIALMQITYIACNETDDDQISDPGAEDCRRQLNNCLDQVEDRISGVRRREWIFLESFWRLVSTYDC